MLNIYSPTKHLAVNEVTVLFKGRVDFKKYIQRKHKLCDSKGYTYNTSVYLGKATGNVQLPQGLLQGLKIWDTNCTWIIFFSSPDLFDDLHTKAINFHGNVKWGDIKTMVKGDLTTTVWKDKRNVNILTNMHVFQQKALSVMSMEML
jgi:hypothetical protein